MDCPPHFPGWYAVSLTRDVVSTVLDGMCYDLHLLLGHRMTVEVVRRPIDWVHPRNINRLEPASEFNDRSGYYESDPAYQLVHTQTFETVADAATHYLDVHRNLPVYLVLGVL